MSAPPKDVEPSELWVKLTATPRPHRVVDLPRKDPATGEPVGRVRMVPLTQEEMIAAAAESERRARKILADGMPRKDDAQLGYEDVYNNIAACEILFRACRDVDDETLKRSAFKTPHEISRAFTNDEIGVLHHNYLTVKQEVGPIIAHMSEDELETWIELLAKGGSAFPLDRCSWGTIQTLVSSLASLVVALRTATSSAGSPPDDSEAGSTDEAPSAET